MAFWNKILRTEDVGPVDYYTEGVELLTTGKFHEALTSFRLALKQSKMSSSAGESPVAMFWSSNALPFE